MPLVRKGELHRHVTRERKVRQAEHSSQISECLPTLDFYPEIPSLQVLIQGNFPKSFWTSWTGSEKSQHFLIFHKLKHRLNFGDGRPGFHNCRVLKVLQKFTFSALTKECISRKHFFKRPKHRQLSTYSHFLLNTRFHKLATHQLSSSKNAYHKK